MIKNMILIPKSIREAVLKKYVQHCKSLQTIAFFQWRLKFQKKHSSEEQIKNMILASINQFWNSVNDSQTPTSSTIEDSILSDNFLQRYEICGPQQFDFLINSFDQIGMSDPFPDEFPEIQRTDLTTD